jgi:hypothetical protein
MIQYSADVTVGNGIRLDHGECFIGFHCVFLKSPQK